MAQLTDDCFAHGGALMTTAAALEMLVDRTATVVGRETVGLRAAAGRVLAENVVAPIDVPPHRNSAVDGYAVYHADLAPDRETRLPVVGRAAAGHPFGRRMRRGEAVRIFTGAVMPYGSATNGAPTDENAGGPDTVMMQEDCRVEGDTVVIRPGIKRGANARRAGEDVARGSTILTAGARLRPQDVGLAASIGRTTLDVHGILKVAVFSTGDEVRDPGAPLPPGAIYDANRYTLIAALDGLGVAVTDLGILPDDRAAIARSLADAAGDHDLVITSGGVSVGEEDHVKAAVEANGSLHFWRLAIKPGRPIALGQVGRTPFVGLPGNPVAAMVTFLRLIRPLILRLSGATDLDPTLYRVLAGFSHRKKPERREWVRAALAISEDGRLEARKFPRDGAGILSSLVGADGLVELPEDLTELAPGTMVDFLPFSELGR